MEGVKVEIRSRNRPLPFYDDPEAGGAESTDETTKYVEAVTGEQFEIQIRLEHNFRWYGCTAVRASVAYDGDETGWVYDISRNEIQDPNRFNKPHITFSHHTIRCPTSGQWKSGRLTFGRLETKEDFNPKELELARVAGLGKIELVVKRIEYSDHESRTLSDLKGTQRISEVSEKVLKGKAITNTVDCADPQPTIHPLTARKTRKIHGPKAVSFKLNMLYRSRATLQMLGCIPRTPSPESESADESNDESREKEIKDLRARLALLERNAGIKSESSNDLTHIKRELADVEVTSARKRRRRPGPSEVVDLTGD